MLKDITNLATTVNDTFLRFPRYAVSDMSGNLVLPVFIFNARQAVLVEPDLTPPVLQNFTLDLENETVILYFSETINPDTFNMTTLVLQNRMMGASQTFMFTNSSSYERTNYSVITIRFSFSDLNALKALSDLGTSVDDTFISVVESTAEDRADISLVPISTQNALQASLVIQDATRPKLNSFEIDFNYGNLTLSFSEGVNISSLDLTAITFLNEPISDVTYNLTGGEPRGSTSDVIVIDLLKMDRDELTRLPLCSNINDCYLSHSTLLANDTMENQIIPINTTYPLAPADYVRDTRPTFLAQFEVLDLNMGIIVMVTQH